MVCGLSSSERVERVERPRNYKPENRLKSTDSASELSPQRVGRFSSSSLRGARSLGGWGQGASTMALISYLLSASLWVDMRRWRGRQPWSLEIVGPVTP